MQLKLKEDPREWQKFTLVMAAVVCLVSYGLYRRLFLPKPFLAFIWIMAGLALILCSVRPRWFRPFYQRGMTLSWHIGQCMGKVMLTLFFLVVLTPLASLLRLMGKDLLRLKRDPSATSFWQPAKSSQEFDRLF